MKNRQHHSLFRILLASLLLAGLVWNAQPPQAAAAVAAPAWTWMGGFDTAEHFGVYGTLGTPAAANIPSTRINSVSWADGAGNLWLFGGVGYASTGYGYLNDLWRYNLDSGQWTWISGSNLTNQKMTYFDFRQPHTGNIPGGRRGSKAWTDGAGHLWLLGGEGYDRDGTLGLLSDLWRYDLDSGLWTWMHGFDLCNMQGNYNTLGVPNDTSIPGSRMESISWTDGAGNLWLFGGHGNDGFVGGGLLNDLWRYNIASGQWAWVGGSNSAGALGVYGTLGAPASANMPGARRSGISWTDGAGSLWLLGGYGRDEANINAGDLNDLWRYNLASGQWTWMSGPKLIDQPGVYDTPGVFSAGNVPGARQNSISWTDGSGSLWLMGGYGSDSAGTQGYLNDLWRYQLSIGQWAWMGGSNLTAQDGVYATPGTPSTANIPGARMSSISWSDGLGNLWLMGGQGLAKAGSSGYLNDLWRYSLNYPSEKWTWMGGANTVNTLGVYGTQNTPDPANHPGARSESISWTDSAGNLWMMGGEGYGSGATPGYLNDLWVYHPVSGQWTWMSGVQTSNQAGVYGMQGTPALANSPGARSRSIAWADGAGNLWLMGGKGYDQAGALGNLNDLWRYNIATDLWTWVSGSDVVNQWGVYGTKGTPAPANVPGARESAVSWADSAGSLWLMGGQGYDALGNWSWLNDLWRYNIASGRWTWMSGWLNAGEIGVYGTPGVLAAGNYPGSRLASIAWADHAGNLWLMGGEGADGVGNLDYLNDLWRYNIAAGQWAWMSGSNLAGRSGVYGTSGTPDAANVPGARTESVAWVDAGGGLWLLGGVGYDSTGSVGRLNDLWRYDLAAGQWTWVNGSSTRNHVGVYGTPGTPDAANVPGGRQWSITWADSAGSLWLLGGYGYEGTTSQGHLNDLWRYQVTSLPEPTAVELMSLSVSSRPAGALSALVLLGLAVLVLWRKRL